MLSPQDQKRDKLSALPFGKEWNESPEDVDLLMRNVCLYRITEEDSETALEVSYGKEIKEVFLKCEVR